MAEADGYNFEAFLRWNSGHLLENRTRGAYAEWLVHRALGVDPGEHRIEWAEVDLHDEDLSLEVKSAAYVQSWQQGKPSAISFPIEQRKTTAYVFCLLAEQNRELVDPRDLNQWLFWVVPTTKLHAERKSIGLQALIRAHGEGMSFGELAAQINQLRPSPRPEATAEVGDIEN
jgi:hypothetical protein